MKKAHWLSALAVLVALCLVGWNSRAQTSSRTALEYKVVPAPTRNAVNLDELGAQGWELIAIKTENIGNNRTLDYYFFKRAK